MTALSRQAATVTSKRSAPAASLEGGSSSLKRHAGADGPEPASGVSNQPGSSSPGTHANAVPLGGSKAKEKQIKVASLKAELRASIGGKSQTEIQGWLDQQFAKPEARPAMTELMKNICRNCLIGGQGIVEHSLRQCQEAGNECLLVCSRCMAAGGARAGQKHWIAKCPYS